MYCEPVDLQVIFQKKKPQPIKMLSGNPIPVSIGPLPHIVRQFVPLMD
jgi:hypothetical protein